VGSLGQFNTSDDGTRAVSVPVNTEFDVEVSKPGYGTTTQTVAIGESDTTTTLAIQRTPALTVEPANTQVVVDQTVEVSVTDEYGEAVANATLQVDGEAVGTTGPEGRVRIPIDAVGEQDVTATRDGVTSDPVVVEGVASAQQATETATPTETDDAGTVSTTTDGESAGSGPGFGTGVALVALVATLAALLARRD
jgi:hypothetical protein